MNILVIDIGTSSMRGILYEESGQELAKHQVRYEPVKYPDGRIEQSPDTWIDALEQICREIAAILKERKIDAIAVTSQRSSVIPVDSEGVPLMDAIMWQDRRNAGICKRMEPCGKLIFDKTGAAINPVFSGSRMTWIARKRPDLSGKIFKYLNVAEYVLHRMTGEYRTDVTYGSRSHLMNLRERKWDKVLLNLFGVRADQLCELMEPGSIVGTVTMQFAKETGLPAGIPVISAGGDQQCAAVGQGVFREGTLSLVAGTGGFLVAAADEIPADLPRSMICNCSSVPGHYIVEANVLTCCSAFDWYCKNFYDWQDGRVDYERINRDLLQLDGQVSTPTVLPYFQGKSMPRWNPEARAIFDGLSLSTDRKELLKALVESICMELRNGIGLFETHLELSRICISGGLTNSSVINQMLSDICGYCLYHSQNSESTSIGALMTALVGLDVCASYEEAFERVCGENGQECFSPREALHEKYEQKRLEMNRLYDRLYADGGEDTGNDTRRVS
ncbi:MAG: hypothetical protein LIO99_11120 [Clostridiales bacterium]|nr:hypothetical protein [Clostridiales bacterium]